MISEWRGHGTLKSIGNIVVTNKVETVFFTFIFQLLHLHVFLIFNFNCRLRKIGEISTPLLPDVDYFLVTFII